MRMLEHKNAHINSNAQILLFFFSCILVTMKTDVFFRAGDDEGCGYYWE